MGVLAEGFFWEYRMVQLAKRFSRGGSYMANIETNTLGGLNYLDVLGW